MAVAALRPCAACGRLSISSYRRSLRDPLINRVGRSRHSAALPRPPAVARPPYLAGVLIADEQYHQAITNDLQAIAVRYQDTVALYVALGGGWWAQGDTTPPDSYSRAWQQPVSH
jgi:hypothetical protein